MQHKVKFSDLFDFQAKSHIKAGDGLKKGEYCFFTSSQVQSKYFDTYQHSEPSLIFGTGGNASIHYFDKPFSTSTDCLVAKLKSDLKAKFRIKFVYYYLHGNLYILENGFKGAGLKHISKDYINKLIIPVFSLSYQEKVIQSLESVELLILKRGKAIEQLDKYLKSVFYEMFGDPIKNNCKWNKKNIGDMAHIRIGPFGSLLHKTDYIKDGIPLVNPKHMIKNKIRIDPLNSISKSKYDELEAYHMKEGDVVLARRGEIGRCALVTDKEDGYLCGTGSMFIRPKDNLDPNYLIYLITTPQITNVLLNKAKGVTMKNLNVTTVQDLAIIAPPYKLQCEFSNKLLEINLLREKMIDQQKEIKNQFFSLMQKSFSIK
jgi:type I restriction enzyme S subunit